MGDPEPEPRSGELTEEVRTPLGTGTGHEPDMQWDLGQRQRGVAPEQALGLEGMEQLCPLRGQAPEQRGHVDLGQDQADLSLGPVELERPTQDHHHALGQLDALLGQAVPERRPRTAPARHVEGGHATAGAVAPGALVLGVDQAHVEVARTMVRHGLDFSADPEVPIPGKSLVERAFDLLVDATDGVDAPALLRVVRLVPAGRGPDIRGGGLSRSLGIEQLTGAAGHREHPTEALSGHPPGPGGGTIDGDGESAGWPRRGSHCETVSRKVGTPQSRVLANGQSGRPAGQCHRKETADGGPPGPHR